MPRLTDDMDQHQIAGSHFHFSAKRIDELVELSSEWTIGEIAIDTTGSLEGKEAILEEMIRTSVKTCMRNPRADNMVLRVVLFNTTYPGGIQEVHGFRPLPEIDLNLYNGCIGRCNGMTNLHDAAYEGCGAISTCAETLVKKHLFCNGIFILITDGENNQSSYGRNTVCQAVKDLTQGEKLESFRPILVGIDTQRPRVREYLELFQREAGFDQYVDIENADEKTLAKLADFISQSITSQSQSLGSGGPSQSVTF